MPGMLHGSLGVHHVFSDRGTTADTHSVQIPTAKTGGSKGKIASYQTAAGGTYFCIVLHLHCDFDTLSPHQALTAPLHKWFAGLPWPVRAQAGGMFVRANFPDDIVELSPH